MAKKTPKIDLNAVKTFFDPHPGTMFCGAVMTLPKAVKKAADELNGQTMTLREAVNKIQAVTKGAVEFHEVKDGKGWISLTICVGRAAPTHSWRVIRYC